MKTVALTGLTNARRTRCKGWSGLKGEKEIALNLTGGMIVLARKEYR